MHHDEKRLNHLHALLALGERAAREVVRMLLEARRKEARLRVVACCDGGDRGGEEGGVDAEKIGRVHIRVEVEEERSKLSEVPEPLINAANKTPR